MQMSIIIPVFNGTATLGRCIDSILAQSFPDYQVIIVDDGSTDESLALANRYAAQDNRITVISAQHAGPGKARNIGLALAQGEYVLYMDADDYWLRSDLLEALFNRIHTSPADVYMYHMVKVTQSGTVLDRYNKPPFEHPDAVFPLDAVYHDLVRDGHTLAAVGNKCVRRDLMLENGISFREDVLGEDIDWVLQLFSHVRTISLLNIRAYAYTQHKSGSRSTRSDGPNDLVSIIYDWAGKIKGGGIAHLDSVAGVLAFQYGICMGNYHLLSKDSRKRMQDNKQLLNWGLDRKTLLIRRFYKIFGYQLTCAAVRFYLTLRRIW